MVLDAIIERLSRSCDFSRDVLTSELKAVSSALRVPHRITMQLCRAAVIGQQVMMYDVI